MTKKRNSMLIALVLVAVLALSCVLLAACDDTVYFTVSFTGEGVNINAQTVAKGGLATEPQDLSPRTGYKFNVWLKDGEEYDFATPVNGNVTLTADWERLPYTVTFVGDGVTTPSQTVLYGDTADEPSEPQRTNYIFLGWLYEDGAFDFDTPITEDIELTADWEEKDDEDKVFTATFSGEGVSSPAQTIPYGETVLEPSEPERDGFVFDGWCVDDEIFDFETPITEDIEIVAKWKEIFTVTFSGEGVTEPEKTVLEGDKVEKPSDPEREGNIFLYWSLDGEKYDFDTAVSGNMELVAEWQSGFTVTFEGIEEPKQVVAPGECAVEPQNPTRDGYRFNGWTKGGEAFDFDTPITEDITVTAEWLGLGSGTAADPYILWDANDILNFAARVNSPGIAGNEGYYSAYYRLGADIDMAEVTNFTSIGVISYEDEDGKIHAMRGFEGVFDGDGHKISNLTINRNLRSGVARVGFFGTTYKAIIKNFTLENIFYTVEAGADVDSIGADLGGVVGNANLTNFINVRVSGKMEAHLFASNGAYIGGLAGDWNVYEAGKAYIAFTENCYVDIEVLPGKFSDDATLSGNLESARIGGLYGYVQHSGSTVGIINCATSGRIRGGFATGGLVGAVSNDMTSIINCASNMTLQASSISSGGSYIGGLVGVCDYDAVIMDSVYFGTIVGSRATGCAGGIIGYAAEDDYDEYFVAGVAVVGCYHNARISNYYYKNDLGTKLDENPTLAWTLENLNWDEESWQTTEGGGFAPTTVCAGDLRGEYVLTLANGNVNTTENKPAETAGYSLVGLIDDPARLQTAVFWDWEFAGGDVYKFYMPVVKDMTLTANWRDLSDVAGLYAGVSSGYGDGENDAGIIQIKPDGTLQWMLGSTTLGTFKYDGEHFIMELFNSMGEVSGTLVDGKMEFMISYGTSGTLTYEFEPTNIRYFGEYYSADGDLLTFSGEGALSFNSIKIAQDAKRGTYVENGDVLTVGGNLTSFFSSMTITLNEDLSLTVNFVGKSGYESINATFTKLGAPDYTGEAFVGKYVTVNLSKTYGENYQSYDHIRLNADGSAEYIGEYVTTRGSYYYFEEAGLIRLSFDGYVSTFYYDEETGAFGGLYSRGTPRKTVLMPIADDISLKDTDIRSYVVNCNIDDVVFVLGDRTYVMWKGVYEPNTTVEGTFDREGDSFVTLKGVRYIARHTLYSNKWDQYDMLTVNGEEGEYSYNGETLTLNGAGDCTVGEYTGTYMVYGTVISAFVSKLTPIGDGDVYDSEDRVILFDYVEAKSADGVIEELESDGYKGVWYFDKTVTVGKFDEEGNQSWDNRVDMRIEKYYKLILDGYGHALYLYFAYDYQCYKPNWGASSAAKGWGTYTRTSTGVYAYYNSSQTANLAFYYDNQLVYSRDFGNQNEVMTFYAAGYQGELTPPSLPEAAIGSYTGTESGGTAVVFNLNADVTGSYKGAPFIGTYDGSRWVKFAINTVQYAFDLSNNTIFYADEAVELTKGGAVTEVIPTMLCGNWTGTVSGYGGDRVATLTVDTSGFVVYNGVSYEATYDIGTDKITAVNGEDEIVLTHNSGSLSARIAVGDHSYEGTLAKAE